MNDMLRCKAVGLSPSATANGVRPVVHKVALRDGPVVPACGTRNIAEPVYTTTREPVTCIRCRRANGR